MIWYNKDKTKSVDLNSITGYSFHELEDYDLTFFGKKKNIKKIQELRVVVGTSIMTLHDRDAVELWSILRNKKYGRNYSNKSIKKN